MPDTTRSQRFADALQALEGGDEKPMLEQFVEGAELVRPVADRSSGVTDPGQFWDAYVAQFDTISTEFSSVEDAGERGILEWTSSGKLSSGRQISYAGVSLLSFGEDDKVRRFATYYDTAAFLEPAE